MGLVLQTQLEDIEDSFYWEEEELFVVLRKTHNAVVDPDMAYVLYTSGSTGYPKGVMLSHENALCFVHWAADTFGVSTGDVVASIAPFHFDLSVYDLYVSIRQGAKLLLLRQDQCRNPMLVSKLLAENKVSCIYATPSLLQLLLRYGRLSRYDFSNLKTVLFAGEVFPIEPLKKLQNTWTASSFFNLYGPTETNVVHWHPIPRPIAEEQQQPFPIGAICPFAEARIKQQDEILVPVAGLTGELLISGESVTSGYLGLEERNQDAFLMADNKRWYKTGDLVSLDETAKIYTYKGRADRMVKRHGYRIELAEVEQALEHYPGIASVVAISINKEGKNLIVVFFQPEPEVEAPTLLDWKQYSTDHLPSYMVPDRFIYCDSWPYTPSQKMDLQALSKRAETDV
jgi:acyl-coenzyme A synthetase/AMP-(fatty) acid ligase